MMELEGAAVLVVGGASGLGASTCLDLLERGCRVVVADLPSATAACRAELRDRCVMRDVDITVPQQVAALFADLTAKVPDLRAVVVTAGVSGRTRVLEDDGSLFPLDRFRRLVEVNLIGTFDVARHAAKALAASSPGPGGERGVLVTVSSVAATDGQVGHAGYSAGKAGVEALTLPMSRELGRYGVRVVTIAPSAFETPMVNDRLRREISQWATFPRRFGTGQEFAHLVRTVLENPMINGDVIRLDAGARLGWTSFAEE